MEFGGAAWGRPMYLCVLAEIYMNAGQVETAWDTANEALAAVAESHKIWWEGEIHRVKGTILNAQGGSKDLDAEYAYRKAIDIAQSQNAKGWELRAATSLARLWGKQGARQKAYDLLSPIYDWFTEGFDTADLKDAKALLEELK